MRLKTKDEPLTPMGRLCLLPEHNTVLLCAIGLKNPINLESLKEGLMGYMITKIPRFSSVFAVDPRDGSEHWSKTLVNPDDHIIVHDDEDDDDVNYCHEGPMSEEDIINSYLADMAMSSPMAMDKPLWEVHVMPRHRCLIMRVHHALADGTSLMSMLWTMGRSRDHDHDHDNGHHQVGHQGGKSGSLKTARMGMGYLLWEALVFLWLTLVFSLQLIARSLWVRDKAKLSGIQGVELWPRLLATAKFRLCDMKAIKKAIPNATIHDVLYGIVWCGLTKYFNARDPQALQNGVKITCLCPYNLREQPGLQDLSSRLGKDSRNSWGNKFSFILLPVLYNSKECGLDPLTYVARAKAVLDQKKRSAEARVAYNVPTMASKLFGSKFAGSLCYKLFKNTTFLLSNIVGPQEEISIGGNPIQFIRVTSSAQPQAMTMHMVSYDGKAELQIQVAKEVISDPKFLAHCFQDALLHMTTNIHTRFHSLP